MKNRCVYLVALILGLGACDEESDDQSTGGTDGSETASGNSGSPGSGSPGSGAGGGGCEQVSPQGDACGSGDDCSVACLCLGSVVNSGRCVNGACADPLETCEQACADFDAGDFSGGYCALDDTGADEGGESGGNGGNVPDDTGSDDGGGVCVPTGDACEVNGDCCGFDGGSSLCTSFSGGLVACSDVCFFDSDCVSGCCVPVDSGLSVCGPSTECG